MCAQALGAEGVPEQHPMDRHEEVPWKKVQEVEMQMASEGSKPLAIAEPAKRGTPRGTGGKGNAGAAEATSGQQGSPGALHEGAQKSSAQNLSTMLKPRGARCCALRSYSRSSSGPAERSLLHGRSSPKFGLPDPCLLTCPPHAICLLAIRNERARRRRLNWPIYLKRR
jgi:hypothetical protein